MRPFVLGAFALASLPSAVLAMCGVKEVDAFEGLHQNCGDQGTFSKPNVIAQFNTTRQLTCARQCLNNSECLTLSFNSTASPPCQLYGSYREDMGFTADTTTYAVYDRLCFSNDCETIKTCKATKYCEADKYYSEGFDYFYHRYACGYGVTATPGKFPMRVSTFPGTFEACTALLDCYRSLGAPYTGGYGTKYSQFQTGSADLMFYKPTKEWICVQYNDEKGPKYYEYGRHPVAAPNTDRDRFTLKNDSIGMSFGIYLRSYYYPCGDCS